MSTTQHEGDLGAEALPSTRAKGIHQGSHGVRFEVFKPGWSQSVGYTFHSSPLVERLEKEDCACLRVELRDFYLSQASALYLLQGASLRQLLSDVVLSARDHAPDVYSLVLASPVKLHHPPPRIGVVVLAHILERPATVSPENLFKQLFLQELARQAGSSF